MSYFKAIMHQNRFPREGGLGKGGKGDGKGEEGRWKEGRGKGKGREGSPPLL